MELVERQLRRHPQGDRRGDREIGDRHRVATEPVAARELAVALPVGEWLAGDENLHEEPLRRVWLCGSYAQPGVPLLESAVRSAYAVAAAIEAAAWGSEAFQKQAQGAPPKKVIVVPGRLVNIVI